MRFATFLGVVSFALGAHAGAVSDAAAKCGDLEVYAPSSLPEGVDPTAVRKCLQHPLQNSSALHQLDRRSCVLSNQQYGCSSGFCWKLCGTADDGELWEWCFQALNGGFGAWRTCEINQDCAPDGTSDCGQAVDGVSCPLCGCGCH